ncbi:lytic transglycosylase domain-containing protein [Streptomyces sp. NBC_00233]|uniref:lytic transglycosylase domain-containing protein n=1 Tax=Streptomyces sp. NBC_00233 TaxID=2975686 RepID=UPI00225C0E2A|nr:lytic murein transglycosylase [Streptomyces sp. NBC_00233]MCX5233063.1 lytic murein transglycosylase [Streptomyces sp. NBC_00233]
MAGIGRVESVHASGYGLRADGSTERPIRGPRLDGKQFASITDTDDGRWDDDAEFDRAVGPTQFIPSTWARWGADGNGDGQRDPNNIYDATLGTGLYLCANGRDLSKAQDLDKALLSYNHSREYVNTVLGWMRRYQQAGTAPVPNPPAVDTPAPEPSTSHRPKKPATPVRPSKPTAPARPSKPLPPVRTPSKPVPPVRAPSKPAPPPVIVNSLERIPSKPLIARAGTHFATSPQVRTGKGDGSPAVGETVLFEIVGNTDARYPSGNRTAVVRTNAAGYASAPVMSAGGRPGMFAVRATLPARGLPPVAFIGVVEPAPAPVADTLVRTSDLPIEATAGDSFRDPIGVRATAEGKPAAGTVLTAALVTKDESGAWVPAEVGPYFKNVDGSPVRTLTLPATGADGEVILPEIFADGTPGTYTLRLTTPEDVALYQTLTVVAADLERSQPRRAFRPGGGV